MLLGMFQLERICGETAVGRQCQQQEHYKVKPSIKAAALEAVKTNQTAGETMAAQYSYSDAFGSGPQHSTYRKRRWE